MMTAQNLPTVDEPEMGYGQLLNILLRRITWFGGAIIGSAGIAVVLTLREDPVYQSSMQLLVEPNYRQRIDITGEQTNQPSLSQTDYATQLNLMRSNVFIEKAVEQLQVDFPDLCRQAKTMADCAAPFKGSLKLSQLIEDDTETRIFKANITGQDPDLIRAFLVALGDVYLTYNEEQQEERLEQGLTLVNQQIEEVQKDLTASREELKRFRESENLIDPEQQALTLATAVSQLEQDQIDVNNEYEEVEAQYGTLQQQLAADPETALVSSRLSQSTRYQQLLDALQETELALQQRLALYAEADPGVQDLVSQRQGQVALLETEVVRVLGEVPATLSLDETALLREGQLGAIDLNLVNNLVQAQVRLESLTARQAGLTRARQQLQADLNEFPQLIAEYDRIQPEIATRQQSLEQLLQLRQELSNELAQGGFSWDVVDAPQLGQKISPNPKQNLLLGIVAGAFVGGALAFGREAMDKVVRTSDELKKQATLPLLGVVPEIPARKVTVLPIRANAEAAATEALSLIQWQPFRDAVDLIYKTIQLTSGQSLTSLMMTSAVAGEGKTTLAIGLAVSAARAHQRVLLIDANWRHPSLHKRLGVSNAEGLSTHLTAYPAQSGPLELAPVSLSLTDTNIDVLPAGPVPDDPMRFLSSRQMQRLLSQAETSYDLVIVDAPPIVGLADGLQLASLCQGVMLVSRLDRITQADLTEAMSMLSQVNTVGMVANGYQGGAGTNGGYDRKRASQRREEPAPLGHSARSGLHRANPWPQTLAISSLGIGALSMPVLQEASPSNVQQLLKESFMQFYPDNPVVGHKDLRISAIPSVVSKVMSTYVPQWSNTP